MSPIAGKGFRVVGSPSSLLRPAPLDAELERAAVLLQLRGAERLHDARRRRGHKAAGNDHAGVAQRLDVLDHLRLLLRLQEARPPLRRLALLVLLALLLELLPGPLLPAPVLVRGDEDVPRVLQVVPPLGARTGRFPSDPAVMILFN